MSEEKLVAEVRTGVGKGVARKLRQAKKVPGVVYGPTMEPLAVQLDRPTLERFLSSAASARLVRLEVGPESHTVLVKQVQRDVTRGDIIHVDFHKVRLDQEVTTAVPVVLTGETERTKDGGIVAQQLYELNVTCLPTAIPESIEVSTEGLSIGDSITVAQVTVPEGVTLTDDAESVVVSVVAPQAEPVAEEAEGEAAEDGAEGKEETADDSAAAE